MRQSYPVSDNLSSGSEQIRVESRESRISTIVECTDKYWVTRDAPFQLKTVKF